MKIQKNTLIKIGVAIVGAAVVYSLFFKKKKEEPKKNDIAGNTSTVPDNAIPATLVAVDVNSTTPPGAMTFNKNGSPHGSTRLL